MTLFQKFMNVVKEELRHYGMSDLGGLDDQETIALNLNLKTKMVRQLPHIIKESPEVISKIKLLTEKHKSAYDDIKNKLTRGDDIGPFLSKQAQNPKFQDYLLLDWNIHHLHLNSSNSGGYFNDRSDYLLMVIFNNGFAYLVDIEHHRDGDVFVKREYLKIVKDNWPEIMKRYELVGALDVSFNPSNEEIKTLRKNQINVCLKIDDKVYSPIGGGINTAGTGIDHINRAIRWKKYIDSVEEKYKANTDRVLEDIFKKTGKRFPELDLDFDYHNGHLVLIEINSNLIIEAMIIQ